MTIVDKERSIVDTNLFSVCVNNTQLTESVFLSLVEYMEENQIEITEEFLMNSFASLSHNPRNINSLLDIVYSFSQEDEQFQLRGLHWRQLIRQLVQEEERDSVISEQLEFQKKGVIRRNRESLLLVLFQSLISPTRNCQTKEQSSTSFSDIECMINACNRERFQSDLSVVKEVGVVEWMA